MPPETPAPVQAAVPGPLKLSIAADAIETLFLSLLLWTRWPIFALSFSFEYCLRFEDLFPMDPPESLKAVKAFCCDKLRPGPYTACVFETNGRRF